MSAHTPGPWTIESDGTTVSMGGQCVIVGPAPDSAPIVEQRANAALIAAAPDLLRELKHIVLLLEPHEADGSLAVPGLATLNGARLAIARAEGR